MTHSYRVPLLVPLHEGQWRPICFMKSAVNQVAHAEDLLVV